VNAQDVATAVGQYHAGIEAELHLLRQLDVIAAQQREVSAARDFESFQGPSDERDRLTRDLVTIEEGLRKVRTLLADHREQAERTPGYERAVALHREASDLVARILTTDKAALHALADAEVARRAALSGIEQGEATLAAYRKVLAPPSSGSSLFDTRG
jgi:hypothetical protein